MSVKCEDCGKEFKTPQGLNGHRRFKHGTEPQLTKLEERVKRAKLLHGQGLTLAQIGQELGGVSKATIKNYIDGYPYKREQGERTADMVLSTRLRAGDIDRFTAMAEQQGKSPSALLRGLVMGFLYQGEQEEPRLDIANPEAVLTDFFDGLAGLQEEVQGLRRQRDEWKAKATAWAGRVVQIQDLLGKQK